MENLLYKSGDPDDPRVGDVVRCVSSIQHVAQVSCTIIGVPQHIGVERNRGRPGAENGPTEIRRALYKLSASSFADLVLGDEFYLFDVGDIETQGKTLEQIHDALYDLVADVISNGSIPIVLGGGHDVAWPTMHALIARSNPFGVINIDAHADVRPLHDDARAHSGSAFRQLLNVQDSSLIDKGFVEFGLQEVTVSAAHMNFVADNGGRVYLLDEIRDQGVLSLFRDVLDSMSGARLYVSLDMDAFASAFSPGVSAPSADGFLPGEIGPCLRLLGRHYNLQAFDVVEVNPNYDVDNRTSKLAAVMIMQLISGIADRLRQV